MAIVSKKIASLGKMYVHSERYFPLGEYHWLRYMRDSECCHAIVKHQSKLSGKRTWIRFKLVILPTFKPINFSFSVKTFVHWLTVLLQVLQGSSYVWVWRGSSRVPVGQERVTNPWERLRGRQEEILWCVPSNFTSWTLSHVSTELKQPQPQRQQFFFLGKQQFCMCITFLSTFRRRSLHDYDVKPLNATIYGGREYIHRRIFLSLFKPG